MSIPAWYAVIGLGFALAAAIMFRLQYKAHMKKYGKVPPYSVEMSILMVMWAGFLWVSLPFMLVVSLIEGRREKS